MVKYACKPPAVNGHAIVHEGLSKLGLVADAGHEQGPLAAFGIEISCDMTVIPARVLPPPGLLYRGGKQPNVKVRYITAGVISLSLTALGWRMEHPQGQVPAWRVARTGLGRLHRARWAA
jgi:hypothetical protein